MLNRDERHLISVLQGLVGSKAPAEFFDKPTLEYTPHEVKALWKKLLKDPAQLRKTMSDPHTGITFETNINKALIEASAIERAAAQKEERNKLTAQKIDRR